MAKGTLIGRFSVCGGGGTMELASALLEEQHPVVEVRKDGDKYAVSSLRFEEAPKVLRPIAVMALDVDSVTAGLLASAELIDRGVKGCYFRLQEDRQAYDVLQTSR